MLKYMALHHHKEKYLLFPKNQPLLSFHQPFFIINHILAGIFRCVEFPCIHADGIFRTDFDAKAAIDAFAQIEDKFGGIFFDIRVRMFCGGDLNASGRAYGFTHHAGHTTRRAVLALGQAVTGP